MKTKWKTVVALAAALSVVLAAAFGQGAAAAGLGATAAGRPARQLILIHGGSFLFGDSSFHALMDAQARAAGFVPHYLEYPNHDLPAAVQMAGAEALSLSETYGADHVYAYGVSSGGTLATILAGAGLVSAAVAKAPVTDLPDWGWAKQHYGTNYEQQIGLSGAQARELSPMFQAASSPMLIFQGTSDRIVPPQMDEAYARKFPQQVRYWPVPGGHWTDRARPYLITRALEWLAQQASRQEAASTTG
jgi:pimeloyl-ACP methyl ester carboxylesterase